MKHLYKLYLFVLALVGSQILPAQNPDYSFKESYKVSNAPSLRIESHDGNVAVFASDKNEIEVFYIVKKAGRLLDIKREDLEEDLTIEVIADANNLEIYVKQKYLNNISDWRNRINVSFEIYTPKKTTCDLRCSDGNITINGLNANQKIRSSDGNLDLKNIVGNINARTSDGNLDASDITGDLELITSDGNIDINRVKGSIEAKTSDGNASIENIQGAIDLVTSDGNISLFNASGDMILRTSDGSITFRDLSGSLKARTSDGRIRGNMIQLLGKLELTTSDGNIDVVIPKKMGLDIYLRGETVYTRLDNFSGTSKNDLIEGRLNGGGIRVDLQASDGDVNLSFN